MKPKRGDIVLVNYPFASGTSSKVRPALIVQCDRNNSRIDNTIVAQITTRIHRARTEPTQLIIEISTPQRQAAGLLHDSAVSCETFIRFAATPSSDELAGFHPTQCVWSTNV
jgi:mRNA-degrading endonuclease toxin of MazEF toxin-antitoxin module